MDEYTMSFRCFFPGVTPNYATHYQQLPVCDIPRWIDAYKFTHPRCTSISCKVWFVEPPKKEEDGDAL